MESLNTGYLAQKKNAAYLFHQFRKLRVQNLSTRFIEDLVQGKILQSDQSCF
jgi:hypothetical protein